MHQTTAFSSSLPSKLIACGFLLAFSLIAHCVHVQGPVAVDPIRQGDQPISTGKVTSSGQQFGVAELRESMKLFDVFSVDTRSTKMTYQLQLFNAKTGMWEFERRHENHGGEIITFTSHANAVENGESSVFWLDFIMMYRVIAVPPPGLNWQFEATFNTRAEAYEYADFLEQLSEGSLLTKVESRNRLRL